VTLQNLKNLLSRRILIAVGSIALAGTLLAQNAAVERVIITRADVSVPGREAVIARAELAPGAHVGRHTHPGEEISYVMEGEGEILIDGKPPQHIKAGEGFVIPKGAVHDARNTGTVPLKLSVVYLVEKGKPIATPVR
jgi:quercetin dioxygenase-like cupin family protein